MAIWQFSIQFVPAKWAKTNNFETDSLYQEEGFDTAVAWLENQPTLDLDLIFSPILPKKVSWSKNLSIWGNDKTHDINVWHEEGKVSSIGFRLDLREDIKSLMSAVCNSAIVLDCVLFIPGRNILFSPNVFELRKYILESDSAKFVKDPNKFLNGLGQ